MCDYDLLGRLIHDRVTTLGSGVDGAVRRISTEWDLLDRRTKVGSYANESVGVGSPLDETKFTFDGFGQILEDEQEHDGAISGATAKVSYSYADGFNNTARRTSITTHGSGYVMDHLYGAPGSTDDFISRVSSIRDVTNGQDLVQYSYLGRSRMIRADYPMAQFELTYLKQGLESDGDSGDPYNGIDIFGRIGDQRWIAGGSAIDRVQYGYSRASLRTWRKNVVEGTGQDEFYTYDGLYQLKTLDRGTLNVGRTGISGTPTAEEDWTYDPTGNWLNYLTKAGGSMTLSQNRTHNEVNEVATFAGLSAPVAYDKAGNMTRVPLHPYASSDHYQLTWDAWNRLVRVVSPAGGSSSSSGSGGTGAFDVSYRYDGLFRRIRKEFSINPASLPNEDFYWDDQWRCVESVNRATSGIRHFSVFGVQSRNELVMREVDAARKYPLYDAKYDTTSVTDDVGSVEVRFRYSGFGEVTSLDPSFNIIPAYDWSWLFHGEESDQETGWYNYGYRYYIPEFGRWISRDPIGEEGGNNLYAFVFNDPIMFSDYLGLILGPCTAVEIAACKIQCTGGGGTYEGCARDSFGGFNCLCSKIKGPKPGKYRCINKCYCQCMGQQKGPTTGIGWGITEADAMHNAEENAKMQCGALYGACWVGKHCQPRDYRKKCAKNPK
jgi:RHS repeat-associated protein